MTDPQVPGMTCEELLKALNDYVDDETVLAVCREFADHLAGCNPCQVVVDNIRSTIRLYKAAADYALARGIIIADTKFEFGTDAAGKLHLIDEALTPDSSRFWPLDTWKIGTSPESYDKQYVRNWLDSIGFARRPPAPPMPDEVARRTSEKYQQALARLVA